MSKEEDFRVAHLCPHCFCGCDEHLLECPLSPEAAPTSPQNCEVVVEVHPFVCNWRAYVPFEVRRLLLRGARPEERFYKDGVTTISRQVK